MTRSWIRFATVAIVAMGLIRELSAADNLRVAGAAYFAGDGDDLMEGRR